MNYANGFDKLPLLEQLALTLFVSTYILRLRIARPLQVSKISHCGRLTIFRCAICSRIAVHLNGFYTYPNGSLVLVR